MIFSFIFHNWRFNPFKEDLSDALNPATITDEEHIIVWDEDAEIYLIRLHEAPQFDNPSSMTIMEDTIEYEEVPRGTDPATEQYRVDYDVDTFFGTGIIEFNSVDVGKTVKVSYQGLGTVVKNRYQLKQISVIPTNVGIEGNLQVQDNLIVNTNFQLDGVMISELNMADFPIENPRDPTLLSDFHVGSRQYNDGRYETKESDFGFERKLSWLLSDPNVVFTNNGINGKRALTFTGNGADHSARLIDSNGNDIFFPVTQGGGTNGLINARRDAAFDHHLIIELDFYDEDKVLIATDNNRFFNAELKIDEYSMMTFGSNSGTTNAAYYTLKFLINGNATAGTVDVDFWRIGNNIGYSEAQIRRMLPAGTRGSYGAPAAAKWSGKGFVITTPTIGENDYVITNNGADPLSNIILDGTDKFKYQVTHIFANIFPNENKLLSCQVNAAAGSYFYVISNTSGNDRLMDFYFIPVYDYDSVGRAIVRIWTSVPSTTTLTVHAFIVN